MSLKAFHIFFITVVTLFAGGFTWWSWSQHQLGIEGPFFVLALCGCLLTAGLPMYGTWFLKKTKAVSFL